VNNLSLIT